MEIQPLGNELIKADRQTHGRTDGRTGMKKLIGAYTEYTKAPKMELHFANMLHAHFSNTSLFQVTKFTY
jgi:hypothetical protein